MKTTEKIAQLIVKKLEKEGLEVTEWGEPTFCMLVKVEIEFALPDAIIKQILESET